MSFGFFMPGNPKVAIHTVQIITFSVFWILLDGAVIAELMLLRRTKNFQCLLDSSFLSNISSSFNCLHQLLNFQCLLDSSNHILNNLLLLVNPDISLSVSFGFFSFSSSSRLARSSLPLLNFQCLLDSSEIVFSHIFGVSYSC